MVCSRLILPLFLFSALLAGADAAKTSPAPASPGPSITFHPMFRTSLDPAKYEDSTRAADLFKSREKLILRLLDERKKILNSDPKAKELHAKILALNKELAVLLESKRSIQDATHELSQLDTKINALELKKADAPASSK